MTHKGRVKQAESNSESFYFGGKKQKKEKKKQQKKNLSLVSINTDTCLVHPSVFPTEILPVHGGTASPTHVVFLQSILLTLT